MNLAAAALAAWGGARDVRPIKDRENEVFEAWLADGRHVALRLHRPGYQSIQAIRSEIWWMTALAEAGLAVPRPIATVEGADLAELPGGQVATVIAWLDGTPLGEVGVPLQGSKQALTQRFYAIGRMLAQLHDATDAMRLPPDFQRHTWDIEGFLGDDPFWGRFWDNPTLTDGERQLLLQARDGARRKLQGFVDSGGDFGLIHADVLRENVLFEGDRPALIDFDDCGFGFRIYDLATLASQNEEEPHYGALMDAAIVGYRAVRPLPDDAVTMLPVFLMLRRFASCGWIVPRVPGGDARVRVYAQRAVEAAKRFKGNQGL